VSLIDDYLEDTARAGWVQDDAQLEAVQELDRIANALADSDRPYSYLKRWSTRLFPRFRPTAKGLYLWGDVGRGKTFLMDLFYKSLPKVAKRRVHFHRFMLEIHRSLAERRGERDPLQRVARKIAMESRVLCLDEFFVADIGDAMILSGLLHGLVDYGVVLVVTSNTPPQDLYADGLHRERFQPAIDLLCRATVIHHLEGPTDYRLRQLDRAVVYHVPNGELADQKLHETLTQIAGNGVLLDSVIEINDREIPVRAQAEGVLWFDFRSLCDGPRSKADYVEISRLNHTLIISDIPQMGAADDDMARRFIELVDELYDRRVNVIVSAESAPNALYTGMRMARGFDRTISRLHEFQSTDYLASAHRP
jgi:cell division protein ZapE